ncbi:MAG: hypothetical protein LBI48_09610 [Burkholderiaceae bacterium]|jgi:hypothetical protein|nr:hypothetical protein [Burkholderiaceae bacterium]
MESPNKTAFADALACVISVFKQKIGHPDRLTALEFRTSWKTMSPDEILLEAVYRRYSSYSIEPRQKTRLHTFNDENLASAVLHALPGALSARQQPSERP